MNSAHACPATLPILLTAEEIARRVRELGARIPSDYRGRPLPLAGILKGSWMFLADLIRSLSLEDVSVDFLAVSACGGATTHSGQVKIIKDLDPSIENLDAGWRRPFGSVFLRTGRGDKKPSHLSRLSQSSHQPLI